MVIAANFFKVFWTAALEGFPRAEAEMLFYSNMEMSFLKYIVAEFFLFLFLGIAPLEKKMIFITLRLICKS